MPYKSEAQRKKFHAMLAEGKIENHIVEEWDRESKGMRLPKHTNDKSRKDKKK